MIEFLKLSPEGMTDDVQQLDTQSSTESESNAQQVAGAEQQLGDQTSAVPEPTPAANYAALRYAWPE